MYDCVLGAGLIRQQKHEIVTIVLKHLGPTWGRLVIITMQLHVFIHSQSQCWSLQLKSSAEEGLGFSLEL